MDFESILTYCRTPPKYFPRSCQRLESNPGQRCEEANRACLPICNVSTQLRHEIIPIMLKEGQFRLPRVEYQLEAWGALGGYSVYYMDILPSSTPLPRHLASWRKAIGKGKSMRFDTFKCGRCRTMSKLSHEKFSSSQVRYQHGRGSRSRSPCCSPI